MMRVVLFWVHLSAFCFLIHALQADSSLEYPDSKFSYDSRIGDLKESVSRLLEAQNGTEERQGADVETLNQITKILYSDFGNVWKLPEPVANSIAATLEPARSVAQDLAVSENKYDREFGAKLVSYLHPTSDTLETLHQLANDKYKGASLTSLNTLFGSDRASPDLRNDVVQVLYGKANGDKDRYFAYTHAGIWGIKESVPAYLSILESSYNTKGLIDREVLQQLRLLGGDASQALPRLLSLLEEIDEQKYPDFRAVHDLKSTVIALGGDPERNESRQEDVAPEASEVIEEVTATESEIEEEEEEEEEPTEPVEEDIEQSSNRWLWLAAAVLVVGGLSLVVRRRG